MRKASDAGYIGVALALAIWGRAMCRQPPPRKQKSGSFLRGVLDAHKTSKMALGG